MTDHRPAPDVLRPFLILASTTLALLLTVVASFALAAPSANGAPARAHSVPPTSRPTWLPMHTAFGLDCAGDNPGCPSGRGFYSVDIIPSGQFGAHGRPSHAPVYSMGAGTLHVGEAHGSQCGSGAKTSFGTWVWIDHGNGVKSRYGHLAKITVRNGAHVVAGQAIGIVGATGKAKNCSTNYLDFEVEHGKLTNDNAYRFDTLLACTPSGARQTWPAQAASTKALGDERAVHFKTWRSVPHGTQFPASSGNCVYHH